MTFIFLLTGFFKSLAHGQVVIKNPLALPGNPHAPGVGQWDLSAPVVHGSNITNIFVHFTDIKVEYINN